MFIQHKSVVQVLLLSVLPVHQQSLIRLHVALVHLLIGLAVLRLQEVTDHQVVAVEDPAVVPQGDDKLKINKFKIRKK